LISKANDTARELEKQSHALTELIETASTLEKGFEQHQQEISRLNNELEKLQKEKDIGLRSEFPVGYQLFGILEKQITI
jgi:ABC-type transporter Mla subunit MlaD